MNGIRVFESTWSRNIAKARQTWVEMGRPTRVRTKPKERIEDLQHWLVSDFIFELTILMNYSLVLAF